jgi:hypothetical protein
LKAILLGLDSSLNMGKFAAYPLECFLEDKSSARKND